MLPFSILINILLILIGIVTIFIIIRIPQARKQIKLSKKIPFIIDYEESDSLKPNKRKIVFGKKLIIFGLVGLVMVIITIVLIDTIWRLNQNITPSKESNDPYTIKDTVDRYASDTTKIYVEPSKMLLRLDQHDSIQAQEIFDREYKGKIVEWRGITKDIEPIGLFTPRSYNGKIHLYLSDSGLCHNPPCYIVKIRHGDGTIFLAEFREEHESLISRLTEGEILEVRGEVYEWTKRERIKLINCFPLNRILLHFE